MCRIFLQEHPDGETDKSGKETPRAWDDVFDREFFTPEEIAESDMRVLSISKTLAIDKQ